MVHDALHVADLAVTLCILAGAGSAAACAADARAAAAGVPPTDGLDVWPLVSGANATSPRTGFPASDSTYIESRWKLIEGEAAVASWQGPLWPNASSPAHPLSPVTLACGSGCLFDLLADEGEHSNVAAADPAVLASLRARLAAEKLRFYSNNQTFACKNAALSIAHDCACAAGRAAGGFFVPAYAQ